MNYSIFKHPLRVFYSDDYAVDEKLETVSKSKLLAEMITDGAVPGVDLVAPKLATEEELLRIHSLEYVHNVLTGGLKYLAAGFWSKELLQSILATTGGMRDAVFEAFRNGRSGSLSSGLHHASTNNGKGYCTLNGLALAALVALEKVGEVGILDLDAHCGGGTADILKNNKKVRLADVSVCSYDAWTPIAKSRHFFEVVDRPGRYIAKVREALKALEGVEFLIYNAGMDTHEKAGGLDGITLDIIKEREALVVEWARERNVPIIFALAGGYMWSGLTLKEVAELHLETVKAFNS
jgi:acetoin utilization deacetylase AcuC-like enzyme